MKPWTLGFRMPGFISTRLFGERSKYGLSIQPDDPEWRKWNDYCFQFYRDTQQSGAGKYVNETGYRVLEKVNLEGKTIMEVGPGFIPHLQFWRGKPGKYVIIDIRQEALGQSGQILADHGVLAEAYLADSERYPLADNSVDIVISFFSLEHLYPLGPYLAEFRRVLRPGGLLVGAIPCEGGLAWGMGRFLTSRRYIRSKIGVNPDKIICWEHPNYAETILGCCEQYFVPVLTKYWPLKVPSIDLNLVIQLILQKK